MSLKKLMAFDCHVRRIEKYSPYFLYTPPPFFQLKIKNRPRWAGFATRSPKDLSKRSTTSIKMDKRPDKVLGSSLPFFNLLILGSTSKVPTQNYKFQYTDLKIQLQVLFVTKELRNVLKILYSRKILTL